ncbi:MAG: undecaprenyl-phosphate glucose phosphotransferase [Alphaproteobacteria bacterium]|nr:undecaprenyl-phosphate glucose phosphotransferase [Alphaproteobacteria bacterium]
MIENRQVSASVLTGILRFADFLIVPIAGLLAYFTRYGDFEIHYYGAHGDMIFVIVMLAAANIFHLARLYEFKELVVDPYQIKRVTLALLAVAFVTLLVTYFTKTVNEFSRVWLTVWAIYALLLMLVARAVFKIRLSKYQAKGWLTRRIALVGAGYQGQRVAKHLTENTGLGVTLVGIFDDRRSRVPSKVSGQSIAGGVDDLLEFVRGERVDEVIVALPWSAEDRLLEIMKKLRTAPVDVRLCPEGVAFQFASRSFSDLHGVSVLNIYDRPMSSWRSVIKNIEDRVLASIILVFVAPLLLLIALAIKLESRGPVLFRQPRYGFNNELFTMYKFRGFRQEAFDPNAEKLVTRNDPRLTRVGGFLRQSHLDELPQFFNVLKGDMSIVGPRAHGVMAKADGQLYQEVVAEYFARHRVKPGITGWAQVNGWTGNTETLEQIERRVEHDLYYIERWTIWLDIKIILMTPFAMLFSKSY